VGWVADPAHFDLPDLSVSDLELLLKTSCLKILAKMCPDRLTMHQKAFGSWAPPGPAG